MSRIPSIAKNTFREAVRDRVLYNLVLFVLLLIACSVLLGELTAGQEVRAIVNIGLNAMLVFGVFIAIFVGVGLVSKEIEKRTVFAVFAKPVRRGEFIMGKYLGLCLTLGVNVAIMGVGVSLALLFVGGAGMAVSILGGVFLIFLELTIVTAIALVFSSFSSPALSALLTFSVFLIGHLSSSLRDLAASLGSKFTIYVCEAIYYLLPNLSIYSFRTQSANGLTPTATFLGIAVLYAVAYNAVLLGLSIAIFRSRDFK